jgi:nodulation protein E
MTGRRVAVTGIGVISALGYSRVEFWESLRAGASGIRPITQTNMSSMKFGNGAEVEAYDPCRFFGDRDLAIADRFAQFAMIAAAEALADAAIEWTPELRLRTAVVTGSCGGGKLAEDAGFFDLYHEKRPRVNPMTIPRAMANSGASLIAMQHGFRGPAWTVSTACSSSNHAIGQALWLLRGGAVDVAIAGGSEAPFSMGFLKAWEAMRVVSPDTCRPFSRGRRGMILGEGGAILVLEPLERAKQRGAKIYAELAGFGCSSDAHHITQPTVEGPAAAMRAALADGGIDPAETGYINAHGTGTPANDPVETRAVREVFGQHAERLVMTSTKSMHGHTLGAAGAIEAVATVLALHHGVLPPTANFTEADPECDLDIAPNVAREAVVEAAVSNSFAFGGLNAVLAFRRAS